MQQPLTNSEAVRRCFTIPHAPLSSQVNRYDYEPRPPYAGLNHIYSRPLSAPTYHGSRSYSVPTPPPHRNNNNLYNRHKESDVSRRAPYAPRRFDSTINTTAGFAKVENYGKSPSLPSYDPLNDVHLVDYFEKRFGSMQLDALLRRKRLLNGKRPSSAGSLTRRSKPSEVTYKIAVVTGSKKNSGTDAKVFIKLKGTKDKLPKTRLTKKAGSVKSSRDVSFKFGKGTTHMFKIKGPEIGDLKSIVVEHNGSRKEDAWFLQEIEIVNTKTKKTWNFICNQWLSLHHGDGQTMRELFAQRSAKTEYEIVTVTGDRPNGGTNANVFLTLYGKTGITRRFHLRSSEKGLFDRGTTNSFRFPSNCVGPMKKIRIEHDNTGIGAGWYLERVHITDVKNPQWKYFFPCGQWLAADEGDGCISRDLVGSKDPNAVRRASKYKVTVFTGNKKGAGTDANVYIILFGEFGDSGEKKLTSRKNNFERNNADEFFIECPKLGRLEKVRIGHDDSGFGPGWFLEKVIVDDIAVSKVYEFPCQRWLASDEDDGQISRELVLNVGPNDAAKVGDDDDDGIPYIITVVTGNKASAGTDARVWIILYGGKNGVESSGKIWLDSGEFKKGKTDLFNVGIARMLSPLSKIDIGHDNKGVAAGWFLESVTVYCPTAGIEQFFPCGKWLAMDEGDRVISRTLTEQKSKRIKKTKKGSWTVWVYTTDTTNAGTDANVFICLYGDKGKSDDIQLEGKGDSFEAGNMDIFNVNMSEVGKPYKLRVWHDNKGIAAGWHLDKIEIESQAAQEKYKFDCGRWLATDEDDKCIVRELPAEGPGIKTPLRVVRYKVEVYTGNVKYAGTDANVYLNIFGERGDTGNRFLKHSATNINKFEKGTPLQRNQMDECEIEAVSLLKLNKIRVGHDGTGPGSGWFLDKIVIKQIGTNKYDTAFTCNRWLAEDEDDGLIEREITASGSQMLNTTSYHVQVKTGDCRGAGTDANVFLKLFGSQGDTGQIQLRQSDNSNKFEKGRTDLFKLEATDIGKIQRIKIGHDGSKPGAGWFLDNVIIDVPSKGKHYEFACHRWLAKDEEDGLLELELEPSVAEDREKTIPYEVTIWTSDTSGSGTDANVFLQMYGEGGKTEERILKSRSDEFEQGKCDKFKIEAADVGPLQKIRIGHDGARKFAGWHCEKILIQRLPTLKRKKRRPTSAYNSDSDSTSPSTSPRRRQLNRRKTKSNLESVEEVDEDTEDYWFYVNRWFAKDEDDGAIVRELVPTDKQGRPLAGTLKEVEYIVKVYTGDVSGAGTDANIFVNLYGENGDSGERQMKDSNKMNKFERNQEDVFSVRAIELGKLVKLKVRHDNKGGGAAWFLDRIEVVDTKKDRSYFFPCQRWLATKEDDGQIARELVPVDKSLKPKLSRKDSQAIYKEIALEQKAAMTTYHVTVETGKQWGAGTDANVYIMLFGEIDDTGKMFLKSSSTNKNKFEKGQKDEFILEAVQIGDLKKIRIGHDNAGGGGAWFLENVVIDAPSLGKKWVFQCGRWLSEKDDDGKLERELYPQELATEEYNPCIPYEITVYTTKKAGASTDADVYIVLYGRDTCTEQKSLCATKRERKECFNKGSVDKFVVELEDVGEPIEKLRIGHDDSGLMAGWHLEKIEVRKLQEGARKKLGTTKKMGSITYSFPCNRWLARNEEDGAIERELLPEKAVKEVVNKDGEVRAKEVKISDRLKAKKYTVNVYTGDKSGCGTDANVFLNIFGDRGDMGERKLHQSETHRDKFERKQVDVFKIEAADLGKVYKIKIRHDNSLINPSWFLDKVEVLDPDEEQPYVFHCERWLARNKDDGKIERTLYVKGYDGDMSSTGTLKSTRIGSVSSLDSIRTNDPFGKSPRLKRSQLSSSLENVPEGPSISYTVKVMTGKGEDNGTDSNVWVVIYGPKKRRTERLFLELAQKSRFEPGSLETFSLEAVDVGEVKQVELGHDGTAPGTGWFVNEMEVDMPTKGKHYHFTCNQWLARDKGDGKTSRIFSVSDGQSSVVSYKPMITYEVTVSTGDVSDAGTDSKITLTVFGTKGSTSPTELDKNEDRFERAKVDFMKMELEDVGDVKKIRIALDGKGSRPTWNLDKIELRNMKTGGLSVFHCRDWLSKETSLTRDIPATERGKLVISKTDYKVKVKTSDIRGAGTDANVYIVMFGSNGDSGEIHLKKPDNNKSPFGNNATDEFTLNDLLSLGELSKVRVWHDNKGLGAAWHLSYIEIEDLSTRKVYMFHCDKWLSKTEDDKQTIRELTCSNAAKPGGTGSSKDRITYDIEISTTDKRDGGTMHNAWMILEGTKRKSKTLMFENSPQNKILRRGNTDHIKKDCLNLGKLKTCTLGAVEREDRPIEDASGKAAEWHCHEVIVTDTSTGDRYIFPCKTWIPICTKISMKEAEVLTVKSVEEGQVAVVRNLAPIKYEVVVYTGDVKGCGTNANVSITLFGANGDTGTRPLKQSFRDLFERNQVDKFQIEALDLGELSKIKIEHDNSGFRPGWFLDRVEVNNMATNKTTTFNCNKWFDKDKGDGEICRELFPAQD
ncbi:lipoxygenase homology domain-containing protein 1 [Patella vulgata]|uniref:lipoxygenase homology domain-containing protein 1 n=1 Tax=Patella vulgata TaxID=6465 RepID=UPI00217FFFEA|nr:lipoxygenase homology domain-containing protein 1 [Patella vulgata]